MQKVSAKHDGVHRGVLNLSAATRKQGGQFTYNSMNISSRDNPEIPSVCSGAHQASDVHGVSSNERHFPHLVTQIP
jgi:hypothetical protein